MVTKKPSEAQIERTVSRYAVDNGWISRKFSSPQRRAVPDRIFIKNDTIHFVEFKAPGKKPTKQQQAEHDRYKKQGFPVHVIDSVEKGKALLDG